MTDGPTQQLRSRVLSNPNVPIGTATMLVKLIDIVDKQQGEINELREADKRKEAAILRLAKEIDRLKGVHGA